MSLDFEEQRSANISMSDYVERLLERAPNEFEGEKPTTAPRDLFETDRQAEHLDEKQAVIYHHLVARSIFLCKRARPDL